MSTTIQSVQAVPSHDGVSSHRTQTLAVLTLALVMRLLVIWVVLAKYPSKWLYTRGIEMGLLAQSLLAGKGLSSPFGGSTGPTAFVAPAYPVLVAAVFRIFGLYSIPSEVVILLGQLAVNLVTVWLIMHVARSLFNQRAALIAGLVWACSLPLIWMPTIFWETSISICMLVGLIALVLEYRQHTTPSVWISLGAYCGVLALFNPALLTVMCAIMAWLVFQTRATARLASFLAILAFVLVFAAWPIRNARVFHAFIPLRTTVGFELWMGNRPGSTGFLNESIFPMYNQHELDAYNSMGELAYTNQKKALAKQYIISHPTRFLSLSLLRFLRFWSGTGTEGGSILFCVHALATTLTGTIGLGFLFRRRRYAIAILFALPLLIFPLPYYITHAEFRYRLEIDPLLTILGAYAVIELIKLAEQKGDQQSSATIEPAI